MVRPICQSCKKPIKGAHDGAVFCRQNKVCTSKAYKLSRLVKSGLTKAEALAMIKGQQ